jgi:diguanylate cyclase (GGDEF)-like protein
VIWESRHGCPFVGVAQSEPLFGQSLRVTVIQRFPIIFKNLLLLPALVIGIVGAVTLNSWVSVTFLSGFFGLIVIGAWQTRRWDGAENQTAFMTLVLATTSLFACTTLIVLAPAGRDLAVACLLLTLLTASGRLELKTYWLLAGGSVVAYSAWLGVVFLLNGTSNLMDQGLRGLVLLLGAGLALALNERLDRLEDRVQRRSGRLNRASFKLVRMSQRDPLTEIYNRQFLMEALEREKQLADREGQVFSVCVLDLDHFKSVNDEFGHSAGDRILKEFTDHLRSLLRPTDKIAQGRTLGRYGGCEFLIILPKTRLAGARTLAERLRDECAGLKLSYGLQLTLSAGVAEYRLDEPIEELLKEADRALHLAKQMGRDRVEAGVQQDPAPVTEAEIISLDAHRLR